MNSGVNKIGLILLLVIAVKCCDIGEYSDKSGKCQQCDISCYTCTSDGCKTCYDQMFTITRGNSIICDLCYNILNGCDICLTSTKCQNCSAGYYLEQDNTCLPCNALFPNCLLCSYGNMTQCLGCQAPYEPINGSCTLLNTNGRQPIGTKTTLTPNSSPPTQNSQDTNAFVPNPQDSIKCDSSEILLNGKCFQAIAFCLAYNQKNGSCSSCISSFQQNNGYCIPNSLLAAFINKPEDQNQAGQDNNNIATTCSSRQYLSDGSCFDIGPQCIQFDRSNGTCYLCAAGFDIYNGLCIQLASNLQQEGNNPSNSSPPCGSTISHCAQVDPLNPALCSVCCIGYTIVDSIPGVCYSID